MPGGAHLQAAPRFAARPRDGIEASLCDGCWEGLEEEVKK